MSTSSMSPAGPRWSSRRRADRATWGPAVGRIAAGLGTPLMPWQQHVVDVALEVDPDTGVLAYRDVRVTVPRQSGKSLLVLPVVVWRALAAAQLGGPQRMVYAAQTRQDARKKWEHDYVAALRRARGMAGRFEVRLANGDERVTFAGGSSLGVVATTEKAAHGQTLDMPVLDEAFAQTDDRMDQAFRPAMMTRRQAQFWLVSTAGHAGSTYLRRKVDEGRQSVEADPGSGIAYFEWSADPDADPEDPGTWWSCMPALGHTVTEDAVRAELAGMQRGEFRRAFLNQWTETVVESVIPLAWWRDRADRGSVLSGAPVLAVDISPDRAHASIGAAGRSSTGEATHLELVDSRPGTDWCVPRLIELKARHAARAVVLDDAGPAGSLVPELRAVGVEPLLPGTRGLVQACGQLYDAARDGTLVHLDDPLVTAALQAAATRTLGDAWAWKRRTSAADITPLVVLTLAQWGHLTVPAAPQTLVAWR